VDALELLEGRIVERCRDGDEIESLRPGRKSSKAIEPTR
jgi:hypothetical protein